MGSGHLEWRVTQTHKRCFGLQMTNGGPSAFEATRKDSQMSHNYATWSCRILLIRVTVGTFIGTMWAIFFWGGIFAFQGKLTEALKGNVEDAIDLLRGLIYLGIAVGALIGLLHGLLLKRSDSPNKT